MKSFKFPASITLSDESEIPNDNSKSDSLDKIKNADIHEGYTLRDVENHNHKFYFEVNLSSERIWPIFKSIVESIMPEICATLIGNIDDSADDFFYSKYSDRLEIFEILDNYSYELTNDGNICFGFIYQTNEETEEIFVHPTKHFSIWTNKKVEVENVLSKNSINLYETLQFIDGFPRTTMTNYGKAKLKFGEVIDKVKNELSNLKEL